MANENGLLDKRLEALETECRRLRRGGSALLLSGAALFLMGQARPERKVLEAQRFVIHDEQGQTRATLGMNANGSVGLVFLGQNRVSIGVNLDSAGFQILDNAGKPRVGLAIRADGSSGLWLMNADGKNRASVSLRSDDTPEVVLHAPDGTTRTSLIVEPASGSAGLLVMDGAGKVRAALASDPQGTAVDIMDKGAVVRAHLGVKAEGIPALVLSDEKGNPIERHPTH